MESFREPTTAVLETAQSSAHEVSESGLGRDGKQTGTNAEVIHQLQIFAGGRMANLVCVLDVLASAKRDGQTEDIYAPRLSDDFSHTERDTQ